MRRHVTERIGDRSFGTAGDFVFEVGNIEIFIGQLRGF
jgi:hypothetical protein